jgi:hypothetical protein
VADGVDALAEQLEATGPVNSRRLRLRGWHTSGGDRMCSTPP